MSSGASLHFLRCFSLITRQAYKSALFSKSTLLFLAGALMYPVVLGLLITNVAEREGADELFAGVTLGYCLQAYVPLACMFFAVSALRDEISSRTLVYLISGPVPRASIWLGKFASAVLVAWTVIFLGYGLAWVATPQISAASEGVRSIADQTVAAPLLAFLCAPVAYSAIGCFCAVFFKRAMVAGAIYVVGWEYAVGSTPAQAGVRSMTVIDSARALLYRGLDRQDAPEFCRAMEEWSSGGFGGSLGDKYIPQVGDAILSLGILAGIALALALLVGQSKDFDSASPDS